MANMKWLADGSDGMRNAPRIELDDRFDLRGDLLEYEADRRSPGVHLNLRVVSVDRSGGAHPTKMGFRLDARRSADLIRLVAELADLEVTISNDTQESRLEIPE